ncbi:ABC transporter permease [Streptomyces sp. NPDC052114]|uniref:ABC transporter permease n=1 Tax=unclassified Streptomyces TaxID=2593676 RepID=UPI003442ACB8
MSTQFLHGPRWAFARVHRTTLWGTAALLAAAVAVTGFLRWAAWAYPAAECHQGPCETFLGFSSADDLLYTAMRYGSTSLLLLPLLIGAFVAGPLIGRELESGLHQLMWTQSLSPTRWLSSKLVTTAVVAVAGTLTLMAAFRFGAARMLDTRSDLIWADRGVYEATGPVLVAHVLFAVATGAVIGLLVRRTLLAVALAGGVTGAVLLGAGTVRWDLFPTRTASGAATNEDWWPTYPADSFAVDQGVTNAAGERFYPGQCLPKPIPGYSCPTDTKVVSSYVDYHPRSHFWYVQLIETGIVLALAAAATYAAFRLLRRHAA